MKMIHHRCMQGPPDFSLKVSSVWYITHIDPYVHLNYIDFTICYYKALYCSILLIIYKKD